MKDFFNDNEPDKGLSNYSSEYRKGINDRKNERRNTMLFYIAIATLIATIIGWFI